MVPVSIALGLALPVAGTTFELGENDFLLNGKPFQIVSGELHPARIPAEYWRHRIQMAKAMGCNTIAAYFFWNYHESKEGRFDFRTGNKNLAKFIRTCQEEGMWVLVRPGPYVCAEWELGGIPPYLLRIPDIKLRCMDPRYMKAAKRYIAKVADVIRPYQVQNNGPVLMVQIENEYGSFGNDRTYLKELEKAWRDNKIDVPFYTADGPTPFMLEAGSLPGTAVGLDPGNSADDWALAKRMNPGVPVFSSETYPGWLTHWGENWAKPTVEKIVGEVSWLLENRKSFNFYVIHGGTNFGFAAGANSGGQGYEPDVTSYDYNAPIDEQGRPTAKFWALRELIQKHTDKPLPDLPEPIPCVDVQSFKMERLCSLWDNLPKADESAQPKPFEGYGQDYGLRLYRTRLIGHKGGRLVVRNLHDFGLVFVDGKFVGTIDRRLGQNSIDLPVSEAKIPTLEILVEGMGRINFAENMIDRKGITDRVTLNGMTLMDWESFGFPLESGWVESLSRAKATDRPGGFFQGDFSMAVPADTFLDMSGYTKGYVWVNGHNLGRYWNIGPQKRLYCPAPFLRKGSNRVVVLDLLQSEPAAISGRQTLE